MREIVKTNRRTRMQPIDRRVQLLAKGSNLAEQKGLLLVGHSDISKACGVSAGTAFVYFKSKTELTAELMEYIKKWPDSFPLAYRESLIHSERLAKQRP